MPPRSPSTRTDRLRRPALLLVAFALTGGCARDVTAPHAIGPTDPSATVPVPVPDSPSPSAAPSALPSAPQRAEIRYLALGDSFTAGTGSSMAQAFPARLAERWRSSGRPVVLRNVAVNGFTTQNLLDREMSEVAPFAPTFVTLAIGANDLVHGSSPATYRAQLKRIFAGLAAQGVAPTSVVVLPQPDWSLSSNAASFGDPHQVAQRIEAFNGVLREEAESAGARYLDLFPLMRDLGRRGLVASDGLHPAAAAHEAWAAEIDKRLSGQMP
ncbi:MAG: SGNH/GDSL hydrolase family protein [Byssovorax sp.]